MYPFVVEPFTTGITDRIIIIQTLGDYLVSVIGHMHYHGTRLTVEKDGIPWYRQDDWRDPPLMTFPQPLFLPVGTLLKLRCEYDNGVNTPVATCNGVPCALHDGPLAGNAQCGFVGWQVSGS